MDFPKRCGKTLAGVMATKAAQQQGKSVLWATADQTETATLLAKHGALCEVIGEHYLRPVFRQPSTPPRDGVE